MTKSQEKSRKALDKREKRWYNAYIVHKGYDEDEAVVTLTESRGWWKPTAKKRVFYPFRAESPKAFTSRVFRMAA